MQKDDVDPELLRRLAESDELQQVYMAASFDNTKNEPIIKYIFQRAHDEAAAAVLELTKLNPSATGKIAKAQARYLCFSSLEDWVKQVISDGRFAAEAAAGNEEYDQQDDYTD